jgi:hypothetical protein
MEGSVLQLLEEDEQTPVDVLQVVPDGQMPVFVEQFGTQTFDGSPVTAAQT